MAWQAPTTLSNPGTCPAAGVSSGRTDVDTTPTFLSRPQPTGFASSRPGLSGANKPGKKGMQLGKAKKTNDFLDSLRAEVRTMQLSRKGLVTKLAREGTGSCRDGPSRGKMKSGKGPDPHEGPLAQACEGNSCTGHVHCITHVHQKDCPGPLQGDMVNSMQHPLPLLAPSAGNPGVLPD